ncbi:MAG: beta-Ala-His dipeptidase [Firmicutes bacterium]|nr:beta-Ala-His dipeptidase [Bacillota bacterium]
MARPSGHEEALGKALVAMGRELGCRAFSDDYGNIIIEADAGPGREEDPFLILQAHMDMVCRRGSGANRDPACYGVDWFLEDGWIRARETSLGADNGIGLATALAFISEEKDRPGTRLIFTKEEEVGMDGAKALDPDFLSGDFLINLDSEQEGTAVDASPGSVLGHFQLDLERDPLPEGWSLARIELGGLRGGHSGISILDIHTNAIKSMAELLRKLPEDLDSRLVSIKAGLAPNAIPDYALALVAFPEGRENAFRESLEEVGGKMKEALLKSDPDVFITMTPSSERIDPLRKMVSQRVLSLLESLPHGIQDLSEDKSQAVTSTNLALVDTSHEALTFTILSRSLSYTLLEELNGRIQEISRVFQAYGDFHLLYPVWESKEDSLLRKAYRKAYMTLFGQEVKVQTVHTGLEAGIFAKKNPDLDILSMGPTIEQAHTPFERLDAQSCLRNFDLLRELVKEISSGAREEERESV